MNREEALVIWAKQDSRWGEWTKPVLFSFMSDPLPDQAAATDSGWKTVASSDAAVLVELPGAESVFAGLQLARFGYRPIPLFNACPLALGASHFTLGTAEAPALVDVVSILRALERHTGALASMNLSESAPPAFLLDANRSRGPLFPGAGVFDNRSIVRASDLPSSEVLKQAGIRRIVLVRVADKLSHDLYAVLMSWQRGGLQIQTQTYAREWNPVDYAIQERNAVAVLFEKLLMWLALRTNSLDSFGRSVHSAGG